MSRNGHPAAEETSSTLELRGEAPPWDLWAKVVLIGLVAIGLYLRIHALSAEGFADDEVHKWRAAVRYLQGIFSGDDVEHPMLMKSLITFTLAIGQKLHWAPESITRLPNVLVGTASIWAVAMLGRRLFGQTTALIAASLATFATTYIGYQRVAKEDTLVGFFLMLLLLCLAESKAAADDERLRALSRWELLAALSWAGLLASKYFIHLVPIPILFYFWVRKDTKWRIPPKRGAFLALAAFGVWCAVNWSPFLPSTWEYLFTYVPGQQTVHGSLFFMGRIYFNRVMHGFMGTPPWFYFVFAWVKLAPLTILTAIVGLLVALKQRKPAHKVVLSWMAIWFLMHSASGSKWGRFFTAVLPAFLLLSAYASTIFMAWAKKHSLPAWAAGALVAVIPAMEAYGAVEHAPHYRLYISPLGGGDDQIQWYFPHCDYFDAGFREAVNYVYAHAEPGAEISTEIDWPSSLYSEFAGRTDMKQTLNRKGLACVSGKVCYVVTQAGRWYFLNEESIAKLSKMTPWHVESIRGKDVVRVYRLEPGESPYP